MPAARTVDPEDSALASRRVLIAQRRLLLAADLHVVSQPLARVDQVLSLWRSLPPSARAASLALAACTFRRLRPGTPSAPGWLALMLDQLGR